MRAIDYARSLYKYLDIETAPIELEKLFEPLKIRYIEDEGVMATGLLIKLPEVNIIIVNSSYPKTKMRFSLAHEIGHVVMPHRNEHFVCNMGKSAMEKSADRFAAELLMPKKLVENLWEKYKDNYENRYELIAGKLKVSKSALRIRTRKLGLK